MVRSHHYNDGKLFAKVMFRYLMSALRGTLILTSGITMSLTDYITHVTIDIQNDEETLTYRHRPYVRTLGPSTLTIHIVFENPATANLINVVYKGPINTTSLGSSGHKDIPTVLNEALNEVGPTLMVLGEQCPEVIRLDTCILGASHVYVTYKNKI